METGVEREFMALRRRDGQVLAPADGEGMSFSQRKSAHSRPMNARSASTIRMVETSSGLRQRRIEAMRWRVPELPRPRIVLHVSGTRNRRVAAASTRKLTSWVPIRHWVQSSARHHLLLPLSPASPATSAAARSGPGPTCRKKRCNRRQVEAIRAGPGRSAARWLRSTGRALTMASAISASVPTRSLLGPSCGRKVFRRAAMAP